MKIGFPALPPTAMSLLAGKPHRNASAHPQLAQDGTFSKVTARMPRRCRQAQNWLRFSPGYEKGGGGDRTSTAPSRRGTAPAGVAAVVTGKPAKDFSRTDLAPPASPPSMDPATIDRHRPHPVGKRRRKGEEGPPDLTRSQGHQATRRDLRPTPPPLAARTAKGRRSTSERRLPQSRRRRTARGRRLGFRSPPREDEAARPRRRLPWQSRNLRRQPLWRR